MQGRTHLVVGTACALAILRPDTTPLLVAGGASAALGSMISDIDSGSSGAGQDAGKAVAASLIFMILVIYADHYFHMGIYEQLFAGSGSDERLFLFLGFLLLCAVGMLTRHRSLMHSLPCGAALTYCVSRFSPSLTWYFAIGFTSHLMLDLFNRKGLQLFFPFRKRFALGFFRSAGFVNRLLFLAGTAALIMIIWRLAPSVQH
ncbi:MAG: metal-dependent hydrolase [Lachnospiraceae bacterium]|nr:metal-dependent hydrolase [Lachnospiraceae bacterium]